MRIGFALPQFGASAHHAQDVVRFARAVEEMGADSLWVGDRLLAPLNPTVGYAGTDSIPEVFHAVLDPFAVLTAAAAVTDRVALGTHVLNAPWYPPALLARSVTTIDRLSGGRLVLGFGTGWSPEEYQAVGVPMSERGARLDECLDVLHAWWADNPVEYRGRHVAVPATHVDIKPASTPHPPIYLAGFAPAAMRRVALRSAGWLPVVTPPAPFDPARAITGPLTRIRRIAEEEGRDPAELGAILRVYPSPAGTAKDAAETVVRARDEAGVDHAFVELMNVATTVEHALDLAGDILARARA